MAYYSSIYKKVKDFFDPKNYDLQRTFKVNVRGDKTEWSLENKLTEDGKVESELKASNECEQDTWTLTASNKGPEKDKKKDYPKFEWKTKRFSNYFDLSTTLKQNNVEFEGKKPFSKFNVGLKTKYDWADPKCTFGVNTTYVGIENLVIGVNFNLDRAANNEFKQSYDLGFQYDVNKTQSYSLLTEEGLKKLKLGGIVKVDKTTGYGEFIYNINNEKELPTWALGLNQTVNDVSSVSLVFRHNYTLALLYNVDFPKNKVNAQIGVNFEQNANNGKSVALGWKVVLSP